jgi:hypothetical protein
MSQVLPIASLAIVPKIRRLLSRLVLTGIPPVLGVSYSQKWANSARVVGIKVTSAEKEKNEASVPLAALQGGDVVISNLTNVLEVSLFFI